MNLFEHVNIVEVREIHISSLFIIDVIIPCGFTHDLVSREYPEYEIKLIRCGLNDKSH